MERDLRDTPLYQGVEAYFTAIYAPEPTGSATVARSRSRPTAGRGLYRDRVPRPPVGTGHAGLPGGSGQRCHAAGGRRRVATGSRAGRRMAASSRFSRTARGREFLLLAATRWARRCPRPVLNGTVEYFHWSPTGVPSCSASRGSVPIWPASKAVAGPSASRTICPPGCRRLRRGRGACVAPCGCSIPRRGAAPPDPCRPQSVGGHLVRRGAGRGRRLRVALGGQLV